MAATPHVNANFPTDAATIVTGVTRPNLPNLTLSEQRIDLRVIAGAEVDFTMLDLDDDTLKALCLGDGPYILVETPYRCPGRLSQPGVVRPPAQGLLPILAHPERSASFIRKTARLAGLVERGVLCSVTPAPWRAASACQCRRRPRKCSPWASFTTSRRTPTTTFAARPVCSRPSTVWNRSAGGDPGRRAVSS